MKVKLGFAIAVAFGAAVGTALYDITSNGLDDIDWMNITYLAVFIFLIALLVPRKWQGLDKQSRTDKGV